MERLMDAAELQPEDWPRGRTNMASNLLSFMYNSLLGEPNHLAARRLMHVLTGLHPRGAGAEPFRTLCFAGAGPAHNLKTLSEIWRWLGNVKFVIHGHDWQFMVNPQTLPPVVSEHLY